MVNLSGIPKQAGKLTKQSAQDVARRIAQEQLEFLKSARNQVVTPEQPAQSQNNQAGEVAKDTENQQLAEKLAAESRQRLEQLEQEIKKYRVQKQQNYNQQFQGQQPIAKQEVKDVPVVASKRKRGMLGAIKQKITDMTSKAEKQRNVSG